jgi:hypothetical protein
VGATMRKVAGIFAGDVFFIGRAMFSKALRTCADAYSRDGEAFSSTLVMLPSTLVMLPSSPDTEPADEEGGVKICAQASDGAVQCQ